MLRVLLLASMLAGCAVTGGAMVVDGTDSTGTDYEVEILDDTGYVASATAEVPDGAFRDLPSRQLSLAGGRNGALVVVWLGNSCSPDAHVWISTEDEGLVIRLDPAVGDDGHCEAMGIPRGITLTLEKDISLDEISIRESTQDRAIPTPRRQPGR